MTDEAKHNAARPASAGVAILVGAAGLLLVSVVVLLALVLGEIRTSREHIVSQDRKVSAVYDTVRPALQGAPEVIGDAGPAVQDAARLASDAREAWEFFEPAADALVPTLQRLPATTGAVQRIAAQAGPIAQFVLGELSPTLEAVRSLSISLSTDDRLVATLDSARGLMAKVEALRLPERAAQSSRRLREVLRVQRTTLAVQRRSFNVQRQTLATQLEALDHIRSIDEKTGGQLAP